MGKSIEWEDIEDDENDMSVECSQHCPDSVYESMKLSCWKQSMLHKQWLLIYRRFLNKFGDHHLNELNYSKKTYLLFSVKTCKSANANVFI